MALGLQADAAALGGVFDGIAQYRKKDLFDLGGIAPKRRQPGGDDRAQVDAFFGDDAEGDYPIRKRDSKRPG